MTQRSLVSANRRQFMAGSLASLALAGVAGRNASADETVDVPGIEKRIDTLAAEAPLKMRFTGQTVDECRAWQEAFRRQLCQLLGPFTPPEKWETVVERTVEREDHVRKELVLTAPGLAPVPMYLLIPREVKGTRPGILALHGHGAYGHDPVAGVDDRPDVKKAITSANYDYGRQLVRQGYIVAAPCLTPFGRRGEYGGDKDICGATAARLQFLGRLLIAENLRDAIWGLNELIKHPAVDADRLGCVGLSYGGRMTTLTAAMEPRIKVAVISGALNCFQERIQGSYNAGCQLIPGLLQYGDTPEIGSLIAPRPCLWEAGNRDSLIKPEWAENAWKRMSAAYRALGAEDRLMIDRFEGGHRWNGVEAVKILERTLVSG